MGNASGLRGYAGDGQPLYGYAAVDGSLRRLETEQRLIVGVKSLRVSGASLRDIAEILHAEGHTPRHGQRWHPQSLARVLGRP